jgi:uncharacterized protein
MIGFTLHALEMPGPTGKYVSDLASLLNDSDRQRIEDRLEQYEKQTTNQVVVVIFPSLEDENLEDFSNRLYEAWQIGQKNRDNGVLLAIFVKERRVRIEVGYGLEGVLTDALSSRIIRSELAPEFQAGRYASGIERAVIAIQKAIGGEYKAEPQQQPPPQITKYLPFLFLILLIIISNISSRRRNGPGRRKRSGFDDWWMIPGGRWGSGGGGFGGGFGGGGGGGFSGGGGGSGGGGASGGW